MDVMSRWSVRTLRDRLRQPVRTKAEGKQRKRDVRMYLLAVTRYSGNIAQA